MFHHFKSYPFLILCILSFCSCTKRVYRSTISTPSELTGIPQNNILSPFPVSGMHGAVWLPSPNYGTKKTPPFVLIHHTGSHLESAKRALTTSNSGVSSHYLISQEGEIFQLVDEQCRAWHAGVSSWYSIRDVNSASIGIELVNTGKQPFSVEQIQALKLLLADLKHRYNIPQQNFIGHLDVAPGRKVDPSCYFPWRELAQAGYGLWYNEDEVNTANVYIPTFDPVWAFAILGYNLQDMSQTIKAFKQHYLGLNPQTVTPILDDKCYRILYSLVQQVLSMPSIVIGDNRRDTVPCLEFGQMQQSGPDYYKAKDDHYPELDRKDPTSSSSIMPVK